MHWVKIAYDAFVGEQEHWRALKTDKYLRVAGTHGTIFSLGDAATVSQVLIPLSKIASLLPC